jgi:AcrR family transcriptional regulator
VTVDHAVPGRRSFRGLSADQRRDERRERLVLAAIKLFGTHGFHRTTVRDVCLEAKLTERYFYESFTNLAALFAVVHAQINHGLRDSTMRAVMSGTREPLAMAEAALRVYLEYLCEDLPRARILLIESVAIGDGVLQKADTSRRDFAALLRGFCEFLYPSAASQGLRLDMIANGLIGATNYLAYDWVKEGFVTPLPQVLHNAMSFYESMTRHLVAGEERAKQGPHEPTHRSTRAPVSNGSASTPPKRKSKQKPRS